MSIVTKRWVVVAGSRTINDYLHFRQHMLAYLEKHYSGVEVGIVTGRANSGPDDMAYHFARWDIGLEWKEFKADWDTIGKRAGYVRNIEMADFVAETTDPHVIVFWDGESSGSKHMVAISKERNIHTTVIIEDPKMLTMEPKIIRYNEGVFINERID